jgi:acyl-phosphate glycerol 3-phosphate acyltransferase
MTLTGGGIFLASYLVGAIPFGYLVARARGVDIFRLGSGNIGATNVGRVLGRNFGLLVFVLDFLKGAGPVLGVSALIGLDAVVEESALGDDLLRVGAGLSAVLGHMFPVYLGFRGGKGVATGAGVVAVLLPGPTLAAALAWLAVVCATRLVSLASLTAAATLCLFRFLLPGGAFAPENRALTLFCLLAAALVAVRHRANVGRLLAGTENRLPESRTMLTLIKVVHLLALGLWFGSIVFFSLVAAPLLFQGFESEAAKPADQRPSWFPLPEAFARDAETRKEQGTRAAGAAVAPLFDWYFPLQGVCGLLAVATALSFSGPPEWAHRWRSYLLIAGVITVVAGWPLERKISDLRQARNETRDQVLSKLARSEVVPADLDRAADDARAQFGLWHTISRLLNFLTILLVTGALVLAAWLPGPAPPAPPPAPEAVSAADQTIPMHPRESERP